MFTYVGAMLLADSVLRVRIYHGEGERERGERDRIVVVEHLLHHVL